MNDQLAVYDDAYREWAEREIGRAGAQLAATGNPIYGWIACLLILEFNSAQDARSLAGGASGKALPHIPWPLWLTGFVGRSAAVIALDGVRVWKPKDVTAKQALARLPKRLGFVRRGWNAFADYAAGERDLALAAAIERMAIEAGSVGKGAEAAAEQWGYSEARSIKRIRQRAARRRGGSDQTSR
jgi:hypothetical protein